MYFLALTVNNFFEGNDVDNNIWIFLPLIVYNIQEVSL